MNKQQNQVKELMQAMGQSCPDKPIMPEPEVRRLRVKLIAEELMELCDAYNVFLHISGGMLSVTGGFGEGDQVAAYDARIDLLVVVIGDGVAAGTQVEPGWEEVHRSNASKIPDNVGRAFGEKWIKGPNYTPPNLGPIIKAQNG